MKNFKSTRANSLAFFCLIFCTSVASFGQNEKKPNILLIMTDQQAWDAVGYSGNKTIITPNLDRLASRGSKFQSRCYALPCVCSGANLHTNRTINRDNYHSRQQ